MTRRHRGMVKLIERRKPWLTLTGCPEGVLVFNVTFADHPKSKEHSNTYSWLKARTEPVVGQLIHVKRLDERAHCCPFLHCYYEYEEIYDTKNG